ncbi:unnamed protein product, partial [Closterium sp. NIES-54]
SQGPPPLPPLDPPRRLSAIHCPVGAVRCEPGPTASSSSRPTAASIRDSLPGGPAVVLRPASQGPPPLPPLDPPRRLSAIHCPVASQGPPPLPPLNPPRRLSAIHCSVGAVRLGGMQFGGGVCGSVVSGCVRSFFALESTLKWCIWTVLLRRIAGTVGAPSLKPVPFRNPPAPHQGCTRRLEAGCAYALPPIPHPPPCTSTSIPAALRPASALCLSFLCPSRLPPGLRLRTGSWIPISTTPIPALPFPPSLPSPSMPFHSHHPLASHHPLQQDAALQGVPGPRHVIIVTGGMLQRVTSSSSSVPGGSVSLKRTLRSWLWAMGAPFKADVDREGVLTARGYSVERWVKDSPSCQDLSLEDSPHPTPTNTMCTYENALMRTDVAALLQELDEHGLLDGKKGPPRVMSRLLRIKEEKKDQWIKMQAVLTETRAQRAAKARKKPLQTHGIWQSAIGYDPYAPDEKKAADGEDNAYDSFQGLLQLAKLTGSGADTSRGSCKKCHRVGHLTFQCRNFLTAKEDVNVPAELAGGLAGQKRPGMEFAEEESDVSLSDDDGDGDLAEAARSRGLIPSKAGDGLSEKEKKGSDLKKKDKKKKKSKKKSSSKRKKRKSDSSDDDDSLSDSDDEDDSSSSDEDRRRRRRKGKKERKRSSKGKKSSSSRKHRRRRDESESESEESSGSESEEVSDDSDSSGGARRKRKRKDKEGKKKKRRDRD